MDAEFYNRMNILQFKEGKQLIERATNESNNNEIDCILDIGCGPGNLTVLFNQMAPKMKRIYAIDYDPNMIEFAKQNNSGNNNNIEYLVQDFGVEWNQLRPELKALEGKVSIIFSNYVLHWIYTKRDNAAENMYRLLSKKGRVYSKFINLPHPTDKAKGRIGKFLTCQFVNIPTRDEQENGWTQSFKKAGFDIIDFDYKSDETIYEINDFDRYFTSLGFGMYEQFYGLYLMNTLRFLAGLFGSKYSYHLRKFKDETTGETMCACDYQQYTFILEKN